MGSEAKRPKIALFGNFGRGNLGNECTLQAMLYHVRNHLPDAEITCICNGPQDTSARYKIPAFPIKEMPIAVRPRPTASVMRWLRLMLVGIPIELYRWVRAIKTLRGTDMLVMTGTGMLSDFGILPLGLHYDILRWSIIAKLCRCRLLFVSVGAGPIRHRLSRRFVKWALWLADYRSYRDSFSKEYLEGIGFETNGDRVYPDLAFSLPSAMVPGSQNRDGGQRPLVGVGLMTYFDKRATLEHGETLYHDYIDKLTTFVTWLLEHEYTVRLLIGDVVYDKRVQRDLRELLVKRNVRYREGQLVDEPISTVEEVLSQLATTDVVIASRFHNVLLALMLNKLVVSISYHEKVDALMAAVGLGEYSQDIDHVDIEKLIEQFTTLEHNAANLQPQLKLKAEAYRRALDEQYDRIFRSCPCYVSTLGMEQRQRGSVTQVRLSPPAKIEDPCGTHGQIEIGCP